MEECKCLVGTPPDLILSRALHIANSRCVCCVSCCEVVDADTVSETNCVRQPFSTSDIGQNKATVLINRINMFWGTKWAAEPSFFNERTLRRAHDDVPDLLVGCVDTRAACKVIDQAVTRPMHATTYWLDIGNNAASGEYVAEPAHCREVAHCQRVVSRDRRRAAGEDPLPSCSAIDALDRQEPFINQTLASSALAMLARLFRYGKLNHHGAFFNAETGRMSALPIDRQMWTKVRRRNRRLRVAA